MLGRITAAVINLLMISILIFSIVFYFLHETIQEHINMLNYNVVETVSTSGVLSSELYNYLSDEVNRFGDFVIRMKLEQQIKPGMYDTFFQQDEIVDKKLQIGDRITIYLEDKNISPFGRIINATLIGYASQRYTDIRIRSIKTAVITKNAKNLVKGYDVIADIEYRKSDDSVAVFVLTKLNMVGKYYGAYSHESVPFHNPDYGDDADERETHGENYIFVNGDFIRQVEYYPDGHVFAGREKLIQYYQQ